MFKVLAHIFPLSQKFSLIAQSSPAVFQDTFQILPILKDLHFFLKKKNAMLPSTLLFFNLPKQALFS